MENLNQSLLTYWHVDPQRLELVRDVMNKVYFGQLLSGKRVVVRLSRATHRSYALVCEEVAFMNQLHEAGLNCCFALQSQEGDHVKKISLEDEDYYLIVMNRLPGVALKPGMPLQMTSERVKQWGALIGKMHQLTKKNQLSKRIRRYAWYDEPYLQAKALAKLPKLIQGLATALMKDLKQASSDANCYGLTHNDIKIDNFLFDNQSLWVFDFDMACQHWYINDVLNAIYYSYSFENPKFKMHLSPQDFIQHFMSGYRQYHQILPLEFQLAKPLLLLRDIFCLSIMSSLEIEDSATQAQLQAYQEPMLERINNQCVAFDEQVLGLMIET